MAVTILLADDHQIVRQGLRALLKTVPDFELLGEAADGRATLRLAARLQPDVVVLDLMMPGLSGLQVARRIASRFPRIRILVLSMHSDTAYVLEALRAGASGYVLKDASAEELVEAIHAVAAGKRYFSPPISEHTLGAYARKVEATTVDPYDTLTTREREVLRLTVEGCSGAEIGARLFISPRTVESHRANLMRKLGIRNQKQLVRYAVRRGDWGQER